MEDRDKMGDIALCVTGAYDAHPLAEPADLQAENLQQTFRDACFGHDIGQPECIEDAIGRVRYCLNAEFRHAKRACFKTDEIAGQEDLHNLPLAAVEHFELDRPSGKQGEKLALPIALLDQQITAPGTPMTEFESFDRA